MVVLPRSVARCCRAVFRRLPVGRGPRGRPLTVGLIAGPEGLRLRVATEDAAAEYLHPSPGGEARLTVPLDALADCEGASGEAVLKPLGDTCVEVTWLKAGKTQTRQYTGAAGVPDFPPWPGDSAANGPELLKALDRVSETAAKEGGRFALHRVLLRGRQGEMIGTDGRQLLMEGGFTFPFAGDLLVPRVGVFGAGELPGDVGVGVALSAAHVLFRVEPWTFALKVAQGDRYPALDSVVPRHTAEATHWRLGPGEAAALGHTLPALPGGDEELAPVTVDLGSAATLRAKGEGQTRATESALLMSSVEGQPVRFATDRRFLARACALGFDVFGVVGAGHPVVCRDGRRTYLWMTLDRKAALPPHPYSLHVPLGGVVPHPAEVSESAAGGRRTRQPAPQAVVVSSGRTFGRGNSGGGWLFRFSLWGRQLRRLADLVADQRRRERSG
jgi:hypothetical protein